MTAIRPIKIYEEIVRATNNKDLAHIIAEAFDEADNRYPGLGDVATKSFVTERALELQKEIETVRLELTKEIEGVRLEIKETEGRLRKEIESVRLELTKEIESVRLEIKEVESRLQKEINSSMTKTVGILGGYITLVAALFKIFS